MGANGSADGVPTGAAADGGADSGANSGANGGANSSGGGQSLELMLPLNLSVVLGTCHIYLGRLDCAVRILQ
jgi:hypothetical protein